MESASSKPSGKIITVKPGPRSKLFKRLFLFGCVMMVGVLGFYGYLGISTLQRIQIASDGSSKPRLLFPDIIANTLRGEAENRINILLVGIGGGRHPGGLLADTIILASIKPKDRQVALMSIPRDLFVPLPQPLSGFDKINAAHSIGEREQKTTGGGIIYLKKTVSEVFGQPVHYVMRVDFEGFKKIVDTLGGVTVIVEKSIYDPFYPAPNMIDYEPFSIKAGTQQFNGDVALKYVRSRETTSDFDRARRQQQVLQAIRDKALSLNILANPKKLLDLAKIVGDHFKTDLSPWEIERLITVTKDIPKTGLITKVLDTTANGPLVSVNDGGYYIKPRDGTYQELKNIAKNIFVQTPVSLEAAKIEIINASSVNGAGSQLAEELGRIGLTITRVSKSSSSIKGSAIYDVTQREKPETIKLLSSYVKAKVVTTPPAGLLNNGMADIVIIVGDET